MPGVVFFIVIPTANYERQLYYNDIQQYENNDLFSQPLIQPTDDVVGHGNNNNLNLNIPDNNAVLRLEVELRDKNIRRRQHQQQHHQHHHHHHQQQPHANHYLNLRGDKNVGIKSNIHQTHLHRNDINYFVPMEKVIEELLIKLNIDHVTWIMDKQGNYYQIIFPSQSGEPCETTIHCLTELGIGKKLGSNVSVLPCSVSYDAIKDNLNEPEFSDTEEYSKWNNFVESIKSKLTVKQVVDGVRSGGTLSFDYLLLIVTADSLAALGLVENNAPNITAAMLVSPLMGPVMSITFGTIISDRELVKGGFIALSLGMFISLLFGFIFGLILGTTEMPWGFGDWPTEEMKGRGNARALWMGVLWALTSGTGVAVALLQGSAGPLIGVAISASLLPPVVNCGLFWALACIWLIYDGTKIPHMKGEQYTGNSSYVPIYTNYIPTEFLINGIVSGLLTVVNVICIFITAIIVLKIKEVAAPYTSSPDLRRFWETDIKTVRKTNRSTIRRTRMNGTGIGAKMSPYEGIGDEKNLNLEAALEQAIREAADDETLQKVKRMSYSGNATGEIAHQLGISTTSNSPNNGGGSTGSGGGVGSFRNSKMKTDFKLLDKLLTSLLEQRNDNSNKSMKLNRMKSFRSSFRNRQSTTNMTNGNNNNNNNNNNSHIGGNGGSTSSTSYQQIQNTTSTMPTIMETNNLNNNNSLPRTSYSAPPPISSSLAPAVASNVRQIINTIANAPHRFSQSNDDGMNEENSNLTQNILD